MPLPEDLGHFRRQMERRRFTLIARLVAGAGTGRVLDAGCGSGWLAELLTARGLAVTAMDLGFDSLRRASRRLAEKQAGVPFVNGDIYRLPFRDAVFDAVAMSEVLEHLERPSDALREAWRVIRPGGCIVVSTPYRERIQETRCIHCNQKTPVNAHLHSFDEMSLRDLLDKAGFRCERSTLFLNRATERFGMAGLTWMLPYAAWRAVDALACTLFGNAGYQVVRAVKRG